MDVEVHWLGRRVGLFREIRVEQPYYLGAWVPADDPPFAAALATGQMVPVVFQSPDSADVDLVYALVDPRPDAGVYFRWGPWSATRRRQPRTGEGTVERHQPRSPLVGRDVTSRQGPPAADRGARRP